MSGFRDRDEMVGIMANEGMLFRRRDRKSWTTDTPHLPRLYKLMYRMVAYLEHTTVSIVCVCVMCVMCVCVCVRVRACVWCD